MTRDTGNLHELSLEEAATMLGVDAPVLLGLSSAGFLAPSSVGGDLQPRYALSDIKAFEARNADNGGGYLLFDEAVGADPQELLEALDGESEDMARRAFDIFAQVFPEARRWGLREQQRFIEQAKNRFEAILAVTGSGEEVDEALVGDLQDVGAEAAWSGSPLPQLLVILRISRDLVVQTAVELAEARGGHWGLALSLLLTRILPAVDRLTDSLAQGYWAAVLGREEDARARYQHVVEASDNGVYEVDVDGSLTYANPALERMLLRPFSELAGLHLTEVFRAMGDSPSASGLLGDPERLQMEVARSDGIGRVLDVRSVPRRADGELVGYQGVVRDITAAVLLERDKNEFLRMVTYDLRQPLTTVLGLAATMESHSTELPAEQMGRLAAQIRRQAERMARLADDLHDVSQLESRTLLLNPRPVHVLPALEAAIIAAGDAAHIEVRVDVPADVEIVADARRLEQVLANLIENALIHGGAPVTVDLAPDDASGRVVLRVADNGPGVPEALRSTLFSGVRTLGRVSRDRGRGTGLGLALVRGLTEAMGGRVWYEQAGDGAAFLLALPPVTRR
jgi:PAS domain S-box-containing protein